jgi:magnesium transporter
MLVNCAVYQNGKKLADIGEHDIHAYVCKPDAFVWVALREADTVKLDEMQQEFDLHPLAVDDAKHGHQRPKIEEYGDSLFAVLHIVELGEGGDLHTGEVDIFVGSNYILSVRSRAQRGFGDVRARCEREPEALKHGSGYVLYALMDAVVDRYFPVIESLETELEAIEERIFDEKGSPRANIQALYKLKQKLALVKHAVAPLLEAVGNLHGGRVPAVVNGMRDYFRDISDHLIRLNQTIDSIRDTVITAISVNLSMITLQESETMKRLAAYAALVAVPTLIAGVYGMNFEHMPELDWMFGYPAVLAAMAGIDWYLFHKLRKARWL